ncbi:MAG: hypothetical protein GC200_06635 [Tepidisphaera sp.]|nr:hypothetical protein [Tepidisphaera sp.]
MTSEGPNLNDATDTGQGPAFTPENPAQQRTHDDILQVLSDFQSGLHSLKTLHAHRQELQLKLIDREKQLAEREAELSQRNAQLQTQQADFEEASARFAQHVRELENRRAESESRVQQIEQEMAALRDSAGKAQELAKALEDLRAQHEAIRQEHESGQRDHASMRQTIATRAAELQEMADRIAAQSKEDARLREELGAKEAELVRLRSELDLAAAGLKESHSRAGQTDDELNSLRASSQALQDLVHEFESLWGIERRESASLSQRLQDAHAAHERHQQELESLRQAAKDAQASSAAVEDLRLQLDAARREADALKNAATSAQGEDTAKLRAEHAELETAFARLRESLKKMVVERDQAREALEQAQSQAKAREDEAQAKLEELTSHVERLKAQAAKPGKGGVPASKGEQWVIRRKARLKNYRTGLRRQVSKVKKASEALSKRYEQCEAVLAQRQQLAEVRSRVLEAERRVMGAKARSRAGLVTLCAVLIVSVIGAMSWVLAREVAPATFLAESHVKASGRGRDLNEAELEEWQRFHSDLLTDPRFHEAAADRFARQGIPSLSTPAAVANLITSSVTTDSTTPDELKLTLKAQGRDRTRRTLEVLTSALASYANAAQQRRIDGGATLFNDPVSVGSDAIDQTQMYYALGMMGAGVFVSGAFAFFIWNKLSNAKTSFEKDSAATDLLDESNWAEFKTDRPLSKAAKQTG